MHDLSNELRQLPRDPATDAALLQALRLEGREVFSIRRELLFVLYVGVATLVAGVGVLIKANISRIGPVALLSGIFAAAALCYALALRARGARRERSLGEDYVLLLGALLFSTAVGYAEVKFRVFGANWSWHLLWLTLWHLASAYFFRSKLVLSVAITGFASWLGVQAQLGALFEPRYRLLGLAPRALFCAVILYDASRLHRYEQPERSSGFRDVYLQFAVNFGFWGALALGVDPATRWIGALILLALAVAVTHAGLTERRESFLIYALGYSAIGLIWLEVLVLRDFALVSWLGLFTVVGAVVLLLNLRARLKEST
ncbi:MAG TPA: DUF2157 domain-containing protein [Steroidobacteraceae bacterium]|nr:DUF2157 domain-containing protein [Steroidobacteraceae bacterium]